MKNLLKVSSALAIVAGLVLVTGSIWGIYFTYRNIAQEKIVTPADSSIPEKPVRGPLTLKAQADIIREHTLKMTGGKTYAEMPRQIVKLEENNQPVLGDDGKPVMVANTARDIWITATTLTTALHLGILTYVFSGLILLFGLISIWTGIVFYTLSRRGNFA
ncbi:MAG: hypothetical protein Q7S84_03680 [bacterium]|nr:hypothetical protein [bacterium]